MSFLKGKPVSCSSIKLPQSGVLLQVGPRSWQHISQQPYRSFICSATVSAQTCLMRGSGRVKQSFFSKSEPLLTPTHSDSLVCTPKVGLPITPPHTSLLKSQVGGSQQNLTHLCHTPAVGVLEEARSPLWNVCLNDTLSSSPGASQFLFHLLRRLFFQYVTPT